jgi:hypothetical protein
MISFAQFSERLARAQLKNMSAVDDTNLGEIRPDYSATVLSLTNEALTTISTKFPLFKLQVDLTLDAAKQEYSFDTDTASLAMVETSQTYDPDSFIKILNVYNSDGDEMLTDVNGHVTVPVYNRIRFTSAILLELLEVGPKVRIRYQARHPEVTESGLTAVIILPPNLETALQLLVASMYISQMNGPEHSAKGDSYYAAYLRHIGEDELQNNSSTSEIETDNRFTSRGFV